MALDLQLESKQAHALRGTVRTLLEVMLDDDEDEELTEEHRRALRASADYFRNGGQGIAFEELSPS